MPRHAERYHKKLTEIDMETYNTLVEYMIQHGYTPSLTEFAKMLGISITTASNRLFHLQKQGILKYLGTAMKIEIEGVTYAGRKNLDDTEE